MRRAINTIPKKEYDNLMKYAALKMHRKIQRLADEEILKNISETWEQILLMEYFKKNTDYDKERIQNWGNFSVRKCKIESPEEQKVL